MTNEQCGMIGHHEHTIMCFKKRMSWTAIIVGAFVGIGLSFLLNLFSVAIGLSLVSTSKEGMITLAVGGFIGLMIGTIASMFTAGFVSGYLGRPYCIKRNLGVLYGFTAWCLVLILTVLLASHMGRYVSFYSSFVSNPEMVVVNTNKSAVMNTAMLSNPSKMSSETEKTTNDLGKTSLLIFALFFIGAVSSCFGGHCGMTCRECTENNDCK